MGRCSRGEELRSYDGILARSTKAHAPPKLAKTNGNLKENSGLAEGGRFLKRIAELSSARRGIVEKYRAFTKKKTRKHRIIAHHTTGKPADAICLSSIYLKPISVIQINTQNGGGLVGLHDVIHSRAPPQLAKRKMKKIPILEGTLWEGLR